MDKYLEYITSVIGDALKRKNISSARASQEAVGNPWMVRNMRVGKSPRIENLKKLCDLLGLDFYIGRQSDYPGLDAKAPMVGTTKGEIVQCEPLTELSEDKISAYPKINAPINEDLLVAVTVCDNGLAPVFAEGDIIYAGLHDKREPSQWEKLIGHPCVMQLRDGTMRLRILRRGDNAGTWNLEPLSREHYTITDQTPELCLPVRWTKKKELY